MKHCRIHACSGFAAAVLPLTLSAQSLPGDEGELSRLQFSAKYDF